MKSNIYKFYLLNILSASVLYYAIDKVFMEVRGLSVTEIILVELAYVITVILLEVPSGAISDRWSRKYVLAFNAFFLTIQTLVWIFAHDLPVFMLGVLFGAFHTVLLSGTDTSFLYDTMKEYGKEHIYEKVLGRARFFGAIAGVIAAIAGGMVAQYFGLTATFWLTVPILLLATLVALTMKEPSFHRSTGEVNYWRHIKDTLLHVRSNHSIIPILTLSAALGATLGLIDEYAQLYFVHVGVAVLWLGYLSAPAGVIEALGVRYSHKLKKFKRKSIYSILLSTSILGFLLVGILDSMWGIIFVYLPVLAFYLAEPLLSGDLHRHLPSSQRATGESFVSLATKLTYMPIAFIFGFVADKATVGKSYLVIGILLCVYLAYYLLSNHKRKYE